MLNNKSVAVVVSAYNEETQIEMVIADMPDFVDKIVIVNDCSKDKTDFVVRKHLNEKNRGTLIRRPEPESRDARYSEADRIVEEIYRSEAANLVPFEVVNPTPEADRIILINNKINGGKGMAQAVGYNWCREYGIHCVATMDGDGQMDPSELVNLCMPVARDEVDYVKGNRLIHKSAQQIIPRIRFLGNSILSILTKIASGYWSVSDTQTGYTVISNKALRAIALDKIYPRYGVPNDILIKLNIARCSIQEVEIRPVYQIGEQSKMKISKVIPRISWLLIKSFFYRLWVKYFFRDFHPLFLLYHFSFVLFLIDLPLFLSIFMDVFVYHQHVPTGNYITFVLLSLSGFQSLFFAMWMDIQDNARLYK